jgi:hypothetical protein
VEFAEDDGAENLKRLKRLHEMMAELGFGWDKDSEWQGGVVDAVDTGLQGRVAEMRKSGLNIMMSMKQAAKPVSFCGRLCSWARTFSRIYRRINRYFHPLLYQRNMVCACIRGLFACAPCAGYEKGR